jgi:signal transduction histidine kinase
VRALSLDLRPALLDDKGLLPALIWYLDRYTVRTGVQVDLRHEQINHRFPTEVETAAYRIIQESLTNVARYAGVRTATVRLLASATHLMLRVDDAGQGFEPAKVMAAQTTGGLSGMNERVQLIGGLLTIESAPGHGTRIIAELPLHSVAPQRGADVA